MDPNQVVKTLKHRQSVSKKNYDSHSHDLPPLQVGDKVRIRPNRETEWRKAEVLPRSYLLGDECGRVFRRNIYWNIYSTPFVMTATPQLLQERTKNSTQVDRSTTASPTLPNVSAKPDERQHRPTTMTTAAGRAIKKPQRLLEHC